jgi:hypothetical protein
MNNFNGWNWINTPRPTYVSGTSLQFAGIDLTGLLYKNVKISWFGNTLGFWQYGYVLSSSYSGGNTTITTIGDTVPNNTFGGFRFSNASTPQGFPLSFTWAPTYSANGSMTFTSVTTDRATFSIIGSKLFFDLNAVGTTGGTASTNIQFSLPCAAVNTTIFAFSGLTIDSALMAGAAWNYDASNAACRKYDASNWGLGTTKRIVVSGSYYF